MPSREQLNDVLARKREKKQMNQKTSRKKLIDEDTLEEVERPKERQKEKQEEKYQEERQIERVKDKHQEERQVERLREKQEERYVDDFEEYKENEEEEYEEDKRKKNKEVVKKQVQYDEDIETPRNKVKDDKVQLSQSRDRGRPKVNKEEMVGKEAINKQMFIRLLRQSKIQSISGDVIDAIKEVMIDILVDVCKYCKESITNDKLRNYMLFYLKNEEEELPEEITLPQINFERFCKAICEENQTVIKRDSIYLLQLFTEAIIIKVLSAADMVAGASKRSRVNGTDLLVAFSIYTL